MHGYMNDGSDSNLSLIGHRLWILSPKLKDTGFGFIPNQESHQTYSAMKVIDKNMQNTTPAPFDYISWPAKIAMPTQYFNGGGYNFPWSVSLNQNKYNNKKLSEIKVELIRINDNKKWEFSNAKSDGYFNISTASYGDLPFTIIFRPDDISKYNKGDKYKVVISNVYTLNGNKEQVSFETTFFDLSN